jgi:hypothetical protein
MPCTPVHGSLYTADKDLDDHGFMPHSPEEKILLTRVRKVRSQLDALERVLKEGADCTPVVHQLAAIRGAINGIYVYAAFSRRKKACPDTSA